MRALVAHQAGVTLVQSIGGVVAVGATLKFVRGIASPPRSDESRRARRRRRRRSIAGRTSSTPTSASWPRTARSKLGLVGAEPVRAVVRAGRGGGAIALERRVTGRRVVPAHASTCGWPPTCDLTTAADPAMAEWRDAAVGVEARARRRAWLRGGVHWNTAGGSSGPPRSGASAPVIPSTGRSWRTARSASDRRNGDRGWGVGARVRILILTKSVNTGTIICLPGK